MSNTNSSHQNSRHPRRWLPALALVAGVLLAYQPVWHAGFIWDDDVVLTGNSLVTQAGGLHRLWQAADAPDYFPLTLSTFWLEWRLWGNNPAGYHVVNVALHALAALLLWQILKKLEIRGAWLAAAIFALHPVNVESVAWIAERKNTLAMVFFALTVLGYLRFDAENKWRWYWSAFGAFLLALLSKSAVVPLPVVLLMLVWWRRGRVARRDVLRTIPFFAMAVVSGLVTIWFQSRRAPAFGNGSVFLRLAEAGWAIWFYLFKAAFPFRLLAIYPAGRVNSMTVLSWLPAGLVMAALVMAWRHRRRWGRSVLFGLGYFVVMLLPVLGFLNISFMRYAPVADRWQYFAIIGPIALVAAVLERLWRTRPVAGAMAAGVAVAGLLVLTWRQAELYADGERLWRTTLAGNPDSFVAHDNLGAILLGRGELDDAVTHFQKALELEPDDAGTQSNLGAALRQKGQLDQALAHFQKAVELQPDNAQFHYNLAVTLSAKGQLEEAMLEYRKALDLQPDLAAAHNNLGNALLQNGRLEEALDHYRRSVDLQPDNAQAQNNLGYALLRNGRVDEAIERLKAAVAAQPDLAAARNNLGNALLRKGRIPEAVGEYERALAIQNGYAEALRNLSYAAWLLATSPKAELRNGALAISAAEAALQSGGRNDPVVVGTLAAAYAESGRFTEAVSAARRGLELAMSRTNAAVLAGALEAQIKSYEAGIPFRDQGLPSDSAGRPGPF